MRMVGTRQLNGFSKVLQQHAPKLSKTKKDSWTNEQARKLVQLVQQIELTSQRTDWNIVSQQIGQSASQCKQKYYTMTKDQFGKEVEQCFINLTRQAFKNSSMQMNWVVLEEYFNKPSGWLQNRYNQVSQRYFTAQDDEVLKQYVWEHQGPRIRWVEMQRQLGFSYSACYQRFQTLYKEQVDKFTEAVITALEGLQTPSNEQLSHLGEEYGIEPCFIKFKLLHDKREKPSKDNRHQSEDKPTNT